MEHLRIPSLAQTPAERSEIPKKILRIPADWGTNRRKTRILKQQLLPTESSVSNFEAQTIKIFEEAGFTIIRDGQFNPQNPSEIGIHARHKDFPREYDRNRQIAQEAGASMPKSFATPDEILDFDGPVIAKLDSSQRGEYKYYLDTEDKKVKFITAALLGIDLLGVIASETMGADIANYIDKVRGRDFSGALDPNKKDSLFSRYICEEFIETPSTYSTSFRIVADAYGRIHFGLLIRSLAETGSPQPYNPRPAGGLTEDLIACSVIGEFLTEKDRPFYIDPKHITSNIHAGGRAILLNSKPILDRTDRKIAKANGIDPDNPQIPPELVELASKIGIASRGDYPYIGADFIRPQTPTGEKFLFLESNISPRITATALGLDSEYTNNECSLILMQRVASKNTSMPSS